jgi:branched-chain amino acid transport system ATP-binding protein
MSGRTLSVRGVSKSFGGVHALTDVSFDVEPGTVTSLIGPNGAGKTTLFNCITGFARPDEGSVWYGEWRIDDRLPNRIARLGIVRTFQSIKMLKGLTVYESLLTSQPRHRVRWSQTKHRAGELLVRHDLASVADRIATDLPLLAQRRIEVARALMADPEIVMFDEPSAGATVAERGQLAELVLDLREDGTTVIVIEHNVPFVMEVSDRIVVLDFGRKVAEGGPEDVAANPIVQEIYLGT